jgi:hypothetical protein
MTLIADKIFYCYSENNNVCELIAKLDNQMLHHSIENESPVTIVPIVKKELPIQNAHIPSDNLKEASPHTPQPIAQVLPYITPKQRDSLFWSLYIGHFGYADYNRITFNGGVQKLEVHQKIVDTLKQNPSRWKQVNQKITKVAIEEVYSDLLTNIKKSSLDNILAYACYFQKNIFIVHMQQKSYWDIQYEEADETIVLRLDNDNCFHIQPDCSVEEIQQLKNNRISLESYSKPLRPLSFYKVNQLQEMTSNLHMDYAMKKQDLYENLLHQIKW